MTKKQFQLTDAEFSVLESLWEHGPQSIREITSKLYPAGKNSDYATVQKLLSRLSSKGCVIREQASPANIFVASIDRSDLLDSQLQQVAEKLYEGSMTPLLMHLIEGSTLSKTDRKRIRELLDQAKPTKRKKK